MNDTICAISTAVGVGAISIVRVSGDEAISIVNKICDKDLTKKASHTINYGHIVDGNEIIDEVMISIMKAPKTFTRENIVEINCHGGISSTNKILELLLNNGARLAEPGEFTKRAFLNGRIDLLEAESVMDMIDAKTENARKLAMNGIEGKISNLIHEIVDRLYDINSNIEVNIDYPEYEDIEVMTEGQIQDVSKFIDEKLKKLLTESENGKIIKDIAGTTRDIVEGQIRVGGVLLNIIDTAGIRETEDVVEKIGVEKSLNLIKDANLIILVLNNNEPLTDEDKKLLEITKDKKRIIVVNKIDLDTKLDTTGLEDVVKVSATKDIDILKDKISDLYNLEELNNKELTYLSNSRQISLVKKAISINNHLMESFNSGIPIDILEIDIKEICETLNEIIGESYDDKLIDRLFANFCLGK